MRAWSLFSSKPAAFAGLFGLLASYAGLFLIHDLAARPWLALTAIASAFVSLAWVVTTFDHISLGRPTLVVLAISIALRLAALSLSPTLSDDIWRYVWDGKVAAGGENPYLLAPESDELAKLRGPLWQRLSHRQVETVYPPLALTLFSIASRSPAPVLTLRVVLTLLDLATCWLLLTLAHRLAVSPSRVLWYAWSPLPVLEVAGMGHVDALGVFLVTVVVALLLAGAGRRVWWPAAVAAAAVLAKVVPLVAVPAWARHSRRPVLFVAVALGLVTVAFLPVFVSASGVPPGYMTFGISWEFNGPIFEPLWRIVEWVSLPERLDAVVDRAKEGANNHELWNRAYPLLYPQLLAKGALALIAGVWLVRLWRKDHPATVTGRVFGVLVLCSATVYPWYLLWILPWAALALHPAWLLLSALVFLSYLPQFAGVSLWPWVFAAIWAPFLVLLWWRPRWSIA